MVRENFRDIPLNELTEEEDKVLRDELWSEIVAEETRYLRDVERNNKAVLRCVEYLCGGPFLRAVMVAVAAVQADNYVKQPLTICTESSGKYQQEDYGMLTGYWVDQWALGDSGDSFAGNAYVRLNDRKFLCIPFYC